MKVSFEPEGSQLLSAQNNPCAQAAYFGEACSEPLPSLANIMFIEAANSQPLKQTLMEVTIYRLSLKNHFWCYLCTYLLYVSVC